MMHIDTLIHHDTENVKNQECEKKTRQKANGGNQPSDIVG